MQLTVGMCRIILAVGALWAFAVSTADPRSHPPAGNAHRWAAQVDLFDTTYGYSKTMSADVNPWEAIYKSEGGRFTEPIPGFDTVTQQFKEARCRRILDLGCGNGRHVVVLLAHGFEVIGSDISASGLRLTREWVQEKGAQADLIQADFRHVFPFSSQSFDGLLSTLVIHHALISEIRVTISEIWRISRVGGLAFIGVAGKLHEGEAYQEIEPGTFIPLNGEEKGLPPHIFTEAELPSEFSLFQIREIIRNAEAGVLALWLVKTLLTAQPGSTGRSTCGSAPVSQTVRRST